MFYMKGFTWSREYLVDILVLLEINLLLLRPYFTIDTSYNVNSL